MMWEFLVSYIILLKSSYILVVYFTNRYSCSCWLQL